MDAGFNLDDIVGHCWDAIPAIASANLLFEEIWSFDARLWVFSINGNVVSRDNCLIMFCSRVGSRFVETRPGMNSGTSYGEFYSVCHHVKSVCLPVNLHFVDQQITIL